MDLDTLVNTGVVISVLIIAEDSPSLMQYSFFQHPYSLRLRDHSPVPRGGVYSCRGTRALCGLETDRLFDVKAHWPFLVIDT